MDDLDNHVADVESMARRMRQRMLDMSLRCEGPTHLGGGLSIVEIMASLYGRVMNYRPSEPTWPERDRFILSKGHGVLGLYTALAEAGVIGEETFWSFKVNDSDLIAHPVMNPALGIESSNGSLGQGLSLAVGLAWAARRRGQTHRLYVLLGDGECNEGSVWEAAMSASQLRLDNIIAIVDNNGFQSDGSTEDIITSRTLAEKWRAFGWFVREVDGHNVRAVIETLLVGISSGSPTCVIAKTVKGKGIDFMENNNEWHHNRLTQASYDKAIDSIRALQ